MSSTCCWLVVLDRNRFLASSNSLASDILGYWSLIESRMSVATVELMSRGEVDLCLTTQILSVPQRSCFYPYRVSSTSLDAFSVPFPQSRAFTWKMGSSGFIPDSSCVHRRAAPRNACLIVNPFFLAMARALSIRQAQVRSEPVYASFKIHLEQGVR